MHRNWSIIKLLIILVACLPATIQATEGERYERRVRSYQRAWNRIIPTYTKLQYAGGMGLLNFGVGWDYGRKSQWETELFLGFIPKYSSDEAKATFTLKQNYIPWHKPLNRTVHIDPLTCGLYLNTIFNDEFWTQEPDRYPKGYYGFSTRVRINLAVGQRIRFHIPQKKRRYHKSVSLYYEVSTCDFYLISVITNHLKPSDFLRLSFGLKSDIF